MVSPSVARRQLPLLALVAVAAMIGGIVLLAVCAFSLSDALLLLSPARGVEDKGRWAALLALVMGDPQWLSLIPLGAGMILGGVIGLARALQVTEPTD